MGLLTRILRRTTMRVIGIVFCSPQLLPAKSERFTSLPHFKKAKNSSLDLTAVTTPNGDDDNDDDQQNQFTANDDNRDHEESELSPRTILFIQSMQWSSVVFDILDLVNAVFDIVFAVRLLDSSKNITYAVAIVVGVVLGRTVLVRGTWLLFQGGIQVTDSHILLGQSSTTNRASESSSHSEQEHQKQSSPLNRNIVAFQLLYCLAYTEAAAFMFETFPSLTTYAFWEVMNFPPSPLETFDKINVMLSIGLGLSIAAGLLLATLARHVYMAYERLSKSSSTASGTYKLYFAIVLLIQTLIGVVVTGFLWEVAALAWKVAIWENGAVPSGELLWGLITICESEKSQPEDFCDERAFLVRVGLAWCSATYCSFFVFFRPAQWDWEGDSSLTSPKDNTERLPDQSTSSTDKPTLFFSLHEGDVSSVSNSMKYLPAKEENEDAEQAKGKTFVPLSNIPREPETRPGLADKASQDLAEFVEVARRREFDVQKEKTPDPTKREPKTLIRLSSVRDSCTSLASF